MTSLQARVVAKSIRAANSRNTPAPSSSKRTVSIYVVSLHISLAGLLYGLDTGSIGPITEMQQFLDSMGELSDSTQGWYVSSVLLFAALSSVADGYLADMFSRKYTIFFGAILAFIGALQSASSSNLRQLFIARAIYGVGIGISLGTSVVYLVEIAPATHRGRFGCMSQLLITVGIAVAYLTASQSSKLPDSAAWRVPFMVQASVALVLAAGIPFLPYSPRWLMQNGREAEAELTLLKLRNVSPTDVAGLESVKGVLNDIRNDIQLNQFAQRKTSFAEIFHRVSLFVYYI
jgi:MFS family permease